MSKLYFYYSTMNAGKTTALLQSSYNYQERGMNTMLYTAAIDDRYEVVKIKSRIGLEANANVFGETDDLYKMTREENEKSGVDCVLVDEEYDPREIEIIGYYLKRIAASYLSYHTHKELADTENNNNEQSSDRRYELYGEYL